MVINDPHEFTKLVVNGFRELGLDSKEVWWRGQSRFEWELIPSVYRCNRSRSYEQNVCSGFIAKAPARYPKSCPSLAEAASWLILMQHYRLPTRLLDWTESPLVALYFAVSEHDCAPGALWALDPYKLNKHQIPSIDPQILNPQIDRIQPIFKAAYAPVTECTHRIVAVMAPHKDLRVLVQQSAFTVHGLREPLNGLQNNEEFLVKIRIPREKKLIFKTYLENLGIRGSNLFPDLENLAKDLKVAEDRNL
jgi:hypothetical protein